MCYKWAEKKTKFKYEIQGLLVTEMIYESLNTKIVLSINAFCPLTLIFK